MQQCNSSVRSVSFTLNVCECQQVWDIYFRMRIAWQFSLQFSVCKLVERERLAGWTEHSMYTNITLAECSHTHTPIYTHTKLNFGWQRATYGWTRTVYDSAGFVSRSDENIHYRCAWLLQILCNSAERGHEGTSRREVRVYVCGSASLNAAWTTTPATQTHTHTQRSTIYTLRTCYICVLFTNDGAILLAAMAVPV